MWTYFTVFTSSAFAPTATTLTGSADAVFTTMPFPTTATAASTFTTTFNWLFIFFVLTRTTFALRSTFIFWFRWGHKYKFYLLIEVS